jgi:hypothetical protein
VDVAEKALQGPSAPTHSDTAHLLAPFRPDLPIANKDIKPYVAVTPQPTKNPATGFHRPSPAVFGDRGALSVHFL